MENHHFNGKSTISMAIFNSYVSLPELTKVDSVSNIIKIWRFPDIGVLLKHPFYFGMFPQKPSSYWDTPMAMETTIYFFLSGVPFQT